MAYERKKRLLYEYSDLKKEIKRMREIVAEADTQLKTVKSQRYSNMPKGTGGDSAEDRIIELCEWEEELRYLEHKLAGKLIKIERAIRKLDDQDERTLLTIHFIEGLNWQSTADVMGYSRSAIMNKYRSALKNINL